MKAARYYGTEDVRVEDIPEPELADGAVQIAPAFNGLCGSDLSHYFSGPLPPAPTDDQPHPRSGEVLPVVFGHVEIVAVYPEAVTFAVADALTMQERTMGSSIWMTW